MDSIAELNGTPKANREAMDDHHRVSMETYEDKLRRSIKGFNFPRIESSPRI